MKTLKIILGAALTLLFFSASPVFADSILSPMTDSVNSGIINTKILADSSLESAKIDATVINGMAVFSGVVYSKAQVNRLIQIARSVSGIRGVDISKLKVVKRN